MSYDPARHRYPRPWGAWVVLVTGVAATVIANLADRRDQRRERPARGVIFGPAQYRASVTGKLLLDPDGEPMEDLSAKLDAIAKRTRLREQLMSLHGLAAAKKYASIHAGVELDSENETLQYQLAEAYSAVLAEKDRELADLRAQLTKAQSPAPPALTVLQGKAEQAGRS